MLPVDSFFMAGDFPSRSGLTCGDFLFLPDSLTIFAGYVYCVGCRWSGQDSPALAYVQPAP